MRILAFPGRFQQRAKVPVRDWSTQEIADFYRAHRLLAENGAGIGIDRGVSDEGEPWMVFFDTATQDVFLHIARIDNVCHLACESFGLRLDAADITSLVAQFEHAVRDQLSIRSDRAKNVVVHPAARIIMSISAVFLLFKLENSEAHAKGLSEKMAPLGADARATEKSVSALARAQSAFARAFESIDAPAAAAMIAGLILAGELVISSSRASVESEVTPLHDGGVEVDVQVFAGAEGSDGDNVATAQVQPAPERVVVAQVPVADLVSDLPPDFLVEAPIFVPRETLIVAELEAPIADFRAGLIANVAPPARVDAPENAVADAEGGRDQFFILPAGELMPINASPAVEVPKVIDISIENLDAVSANLGLVAEVDLSVSDVFSIVSFFRSRIETESSYLGGHWLFEQSGIKGLDASQVGIFTGVVEDGSRATIIGRIDLIDDAMHFFA